MIGLFVASSLALAAPTLRPGFAVVADNVAVTAAQLPEALRETFPDRFATSSAAKKAVRRKLVLVGESDDGPRLRIDDRVPIGTRVRLLSRVAPGPAAGEGRRGRCDDPLECCFEDDHLAVVYKPPGLSVQGDVRSRLTGLTPTRCVDREPLWRPQHVHRLDAPTSGLLVVAKTGQALRTLSASFADRHVHKQYRAIVAGHVGPYAHRGTITLPLSGQDARTDYRVLGTYPSDVYGTISLVALSPVTGRTHQLRRHMAMLGHPILGDHKYWPNHLPPHEPMVVEEEEEDDEQVLMLSATRLELPHPVTGATIQIQTPQPASFDRLCRQSDVVDPSAAVTSRESNVETRHLPPPLTFSRPFRGPFLRRRHTSPLLSVAPPATPAATPTPPSLQLLKWSHLADFAAGDLTPTRALDDDGRVCYALTNDETAVRLGTAASLDRYRVGFYFGLWYILSVVYSVKNKQAHIALGLPLSIATAQVVGGAGIAALLWGLRIRSPPKLSSAAFRTLLPIGLFHGIGHLTGVLATALGSVSFVQVVKSAGPFWACILTSLFLGQKNSRRVWLSLVPVVGGVGLASANELKFV